MKKTFILSVFVLNYAIGQSITISPTSGNTGNINISSTTGGIAIPRVTATQKSAISNPTQGLLIYQTDSPSGFWVNRSGIPSIPNWSLLTEGENLWSRNIVNNNNISPTNTGNIGIGTSVPTEKLTVQTASNAYGISHTDGTNTISTYVGGNAGWLGTKTLAPLYFYTNGGSTQMTLTTSGNLGVGTSTPSSRLAIQTPANRAGFTHTNGTVDLATFTTTTVGGIGTTTNHPLTLFTNNSTGSPAITVATDGNVGIGNSTPNAPLSFALGATPKISLNGTADKGIGISNSGDVNFYSNSSFMFGSGTNSSFNKAVEISSSGLLGINLGAISPSGRVDMGSTDGNNLVLRNLNSLVSSNNNNMYFKNGNYWTGRISAMGTSTTEANLSFFTGASTSFSGLTEKMTIANNGNVGIGNSSPNAKLDVNGNVKIANGLDVTGSMKIVNGTQGANKVLTSDAAGNASWQTQVASYENLERFYLTRFESPLASTVTYDVVYNLSNNISINTTNGIITINKTGLYQFDYSIECYGNPTKIVGNTALNATPPSTGYNINAYTLNFRVVRSGGSNINIPIQIPMYLETYYTFGGETSTGKGQKSNSIKLHITAGSTINIETSGSPQSPSRFNFQISGNLVSE